jgi:hypothetical protein
MMSGKTQFIEESKRKLCQLKKGHTFVCLKGRLIFGAQAQLFSQTASRRGRSEVVGKCRIFCFPGPTRPDRKIATTLVVFWILAVCCRKMSQE